MWKYNPINGNIVNTKTGEELSNDPLIVAKLNNLEDKLNEYTTKAKEPLPPISTESIH